jgi:hypothetical protein
MPRAAILIATALAAGCLAGAPSGEPDAQARSGSCDVVGDLMSRDGELCFCGNDHRWRCLSLDDPGDMGPGQD